MKRLTEILIPIIAANSSFAQKQNKNMVFIGNSINYGALLSDGTYSARISIENYKVNLESHC